MSRNKRKAIFYVLFVLFFIIGAAVVFYAQGWRFDFTTWRAEKVGAIFVRSFPTDARILLDGKPIANQSGFLSRGTLISNLFPRTYSLTLTENGYDEWRENIAVLPALVTELKDAVLVPQTPEVVSTSTVKQFSIISGETITQTANDAIVWRGKTIGRGEIVSESADLHAIIIKNAGAGTFSLYDFTEGTSTNLSAVLLKNGVNAATLTDLLIDPRDATNIIAINTHQVWTFTTTQGAATTVGRTTGGETIGSSLAVSPSLIAWTKFGNSSGASVVLYDRFAKIAKESSGTVPGQTRDLQWISDALLGVLQSDGSLYSYDVNAQQFQKLADDAKEFRTADDGTAVAVLENKSVEILPQSDAQTYRRFNLSDIANAEQVLWYRDMNHLFVIYPASVSFLDLDDLGLRNFVRVADGVKPLYKPDENVLYLVNSAQKIIKFDFPK
jgi:hypothetical protein